MKNEKNKETNLAYGGSALIEGIMMRGKNSYALTIKKTDGSFYKEKVEYVALGKKIKILGFPFIRGIVGFFENMVIEIKVLNKSAEIAFPEEGEQKISNFALFITFALAMVIAMGLFVALPYFLTQLTGIKHNEQTFQYNLVTGIIRMIFFFVYLVLISFMEDAKRLFGFHGAEHKTIHTYEDEKDLTVENVKNHSRLHPRCGTAFLFLVFLITIVVFPFINEFFIAQSWYKALSSYGKLGDILQKIVIICSHIIIGMPIVASISYELLKLSGKFYKNILVKILVAPGLFMQLFTTREPNEDMIKAGIISLNMVTGKEEVDVPRSVNDNITIDKYNPSIVATVLFLPVVFFNLVRRRKKGQKGNREKKTGRARRTKSRKGKKKRGQRRGKRGEKKKEEGRRGRKEEKKERRKKENRKAKSGKRERRREKKEKKKKRNKNKEGEKKEKNGRRGEK